MSSPAPPDQPSRVNGPGELAKLQIRRVKWDDLPEIYKINTKSFVFPYSMQVFKEFFYKHRNCFYVVEPEGKIIGFVMGKIERSFSGVRFRKLGHVMSVAVVPEHQRRGIGKELMEKIMDAFLTLGCDKITLEVRVSNAIARKLYTKLGFKVERMVDYYYRDGEAACYMTRSL